MPSLAEQRPKIDPFGTSQTPDSSQKSPPKGPRGLIFKTLGRKSSNCAAEAALSILTTHSEGWGPKTPTFSNVFFGGQGRFDQSKISGQRSQKEDLKDLKHLKWPTAAHRTGQPRATASLISSWPSFTW